MQRNEIAVSSLHINQTVAAARITLLSEVMAASTTGRVTTSVSSPYIRGNSFRKPRVKVIDIWPPLLPPPRSQPINRQVLEWKVIKQPSITGGGGGGFGLSFGGWSLDFGGRWPMLRVQHGWLEFECARGECVCADCGWKVFASFPAPQTTWAARSACNGRTRW